MSFAISLKQNVLTQASLVCSARITSTTAFRSRATTVCVKTALPLSHVSATLDTSVPSVISKFKSATATHVRTEGAASIWSMPTSVTAHLEPQVGMCEQWIVYYKKRIEIFTPPHYLCVGMQFYILSHSQYLGNTLHIFFHLELPEPFGWAYNIP